MRYDPISNMFRVYEGGSGGGQTSSTQTVQNFSPQEAAARAAVQAEAARIYGETSGAITSAPYPGSVPVPASAATTAGQNTALNTANFLQDTTVPQLAQAQQFGMFDVLNPASNPALQGSIEAAIRPVTQAYTDPGGVLSTIRADSMNAGQYGGSRMNLAEGVAGGRYLQTIGDISATRTSDAYNKGLDTFSRTMALTPQNMQAALMPAQAMSAVGTQQEQYGQQGEDYAAAVRQWGMNAPWAALQNYANVVYGGSAPGTMTTGMSSGGGTSKAMSALGGAAMGASIGSVVPGVGTLIGAGIGLMMGLFS